MLKLNSIFYSLLFLTLFSCTNKSNHEIDYDGIVFFTLDTNVKEDIEYLKKDIVKNELKIGLTDSLYKSYKVKTEEYIIYLEKLNLLCQKVENNPFFEKEILTSEGKQFIKKTNDYLKELNTLNNDLKLRDRIDSLLGVNDVLADNNMYFKYLDYYFKGLPKSFFIHQMNNRKRNVLLIQNEIIDMILLEECSKNQK